MVSIAIFASGNGSNAQRIAEYFSKHDSIRVRLIVCNKADAYVMTRAVSLGIPAVLIRRDEFYDGHTLSGILRQYHIDWLVLAGFLWLVAPDLIRQFPGRILNIHPALLPRYGGKGMYGMRVHQAVIEAGDKESGITIHEVNERYDEGNIIFQARCSIGQRETPETLAEKIHDLEYRYYPEVIEKVTLRLLKNE